MTDVAQMAVAYLAYDQGALEEEIGQRLSVAAGRPEAATLPPGQFAADVADLGIGADALELATRIFRRSSKELYHVFCGTDADDATDRQKLRDALHLGDEALVAAIAACLAGPFGIGGAVAAAIAALILKRIFKPAGDEVCKFWGEKLAAK